LETVVGTLKDAINFDLENSFASRAFGVMLKGLGIALVGRFCSDICRDCGEQTLANGVESVGRIAIFALSVPMLVEILSFAYELL
jgi:stage III sporulation protein AD